MSAQLGPQRPELLPTVNICSLKIDKWAFSKGPSMTLSSLEVMELRPTT